MVLQITVVDAGYLKEAVRAVLTAGSGVVIIIWCPEFLAVQSVFPGRMPEGENATALLKIPPESFTAYHSQDHHFNAAIKAADLEVVFRTAKDSDYIEFSQSFKDNDDVNGYGYLNAYFNRPVATRYAILPQGAFMTFHIPMKIYGILPEGVVRSTDISHDTSAIPLPPVATFRAFPFAQCMSILKKSGSKVLLNVLEKEVLFFKQGRSLNPMVVNQVNGLISTREDCKIQPIQFYIHMENVEFKPAAVLSDEVSLFQRSENGVLIWFKLEVPKGDIIHYLY